MFSVVQFIDFPKEPVMPELSEREKEAMKYGGVLYPGAEDVMAINRAVAEGNCRAAPPKREKCQINLREQAKRDRKRAEELFRRANEAERVADQIDRMPPEIEGLIADYFGMAISGNSVRSVVESFY